MLAAVVRGEPCLAPAGGVCVCGVVVRSMSCVVFIIRVLHIYRSAFRSLA
jgi:hypothetical protein